MIADLDTNEDFRRREFPICARKIYCAHAADAPLPRRVAEAMRDAIEDASTNEKQFDRALDFIADTRRLLADFLGAETEEISLSGPTSSGLNAVANGLDWKAGDEVVCYLDDYPADVYPWLGLERKGVTPVLLHTERLGEITPEIVERALTNERAWSPSRVRITPADTELTLRQLAKCAQNAASYFRSMGSKRLVRFPSR